ncbi:unnamed protein product [Strongylus vulgaris]|uniref:ShKT domain-containing protein n=1 Tax=Strongylus vulgaris TaxID=40348 RepID=A0A3P7KXB1_STRVU|nr:unnamed protein product [Strongylus vulgaris]
MYFVVIVVSLTIVTNAAITDKNCTTADGKMDDKESEEKKQAIISMCPKTCGYCCLTPAYNCANKESVTHPGGVTYAPGSCMDNSKTYV